MHKSSREITKLFLGFSMSAWINAVINFVLTPVITRLVDPVNLGKIDLFITFCNMFVYASTLGMHQAYMRFFNDLPAGVTKKNLLSFAVRISTFGALLAGVICIVFSNHFSIEILGFYDIRIAILMSVFILANGFIQIIKTKPRMYGKIIPYTIIVVAESAFVKIAYLSSVYYKKILSSIAFYVCITILFALICLIVNSNQIFVSVKSITRESITTIFKYAIPTIPVMFISNLNSSIPKIFLNHIFDSSNVGIYAGCLTVVNIIHLIQAGINVFWGPYVFENYKNNKEQIQKVHLVITFVMCFCGLGLIAGQDIIFYILGEKYRASKIFYAFLLASPICYTVGETLGIGISIVKKTYWNIVVVSVALACNCLLCYLLVPKFGNVGASISVMVSSFLMVIIKSIIGEKYYKVVNSPIKSYGAMILYMLAAILSFITFTQPILRILVVLTVLLVLVIIYYKDLKTFLLNFRYQRGES